MSQAVTQLCAHVMPNDAGELSRQRKSRQLSSSILRNAVSEDDEPRTIPSLSDGLSEFEG
jgi:hypothetical protein